MSVTVKKRLPINRKPPRIMEGDGEHRAPHRNERCAGSVSRARLKLEKTAQVKGRSAEIAREARKMYGDAIDAGHRRGRELVEENAKKL